MEELIELLKNLEGEGCIVKGVDVPTAYGESIECDAVLVHCTGIFVFQVIECKGGVSGKAEDELWSDGFKKFTNPMTVAATQKAALAKYLGIAANKIRCYAVMTGNCKLKNIPMDTKDVNVVMFEVLGKKITGAIKRGSLQFGSIEIGAVARALESASISDRKRETVKLVYEGDFKPAGKSRALFTLVLAIITLAGAVGFIWISPVVTAVLLVLTVAVTWFADWIVKTGAATFIRILCLAVAVATVVIQWV